jgi:hypothetical protein
MVYSAARADERCQKTRTNNVHERTLLLLIIFCMGFLLSDGRLALMAGKYSDRKYKLPKRD